MEYRKITEKEFLANAEYFKVQIPTAQNTRQEYFYDVFEYYKDHLKDKRNYISVYINNNDIIACALVCFYKEEHKYFLLNVNTRVDYQNKGVASKLLNATLQDFFNEHNESIYLWVSPKNEVANKLYSKLGFVKTGYFPEKLEFSDNIRNDNILYCNADLFKSRNLNSKEDSLNK